MKHTLERWFERLLWNSRFVVVAVVASVVSAFAAFHIATVDVAYLGMHLAPYASGAIALVGLALFLSHKAEANHAKPD